MGILDQITQQLSPTRVGIVEFAESSDYCHKQLYPRQQVLLKLFFLEELTGEEEDTLTFWMNGGRNGSEITLSPSIRERTEWLRENDYKHFREIVLPGGRRSSKGFITGIAMAYAMWECLQLQDPGAHYGIDPEKEIFFSCVAGSEQQAKEFQYADLSSTIETCKAFEPYLVKSLETEIRVATNADLRKTNYSRAQGNKIQKDIARLRGKALAANAGTLRGSATMAICIDEVAHMIPGESKAAADQVYNAADPSLDQFGLDGLMFLNSSPYTKVGAFFERYSAALVPFDPRRPIDEIGSFGGEEVDINDLNGNPRIMTFQYPSWALYDGYQKSPKRKQLKKVIMASPDWDYEGEELDEKGEPLWNAEDKRYIKQARAKESENPDAYKVERRGKFAEVTDAFLNPELVDRTFAGVPHEWVRRYIGEREQWELVLEPLPTNWGAKAINTNRYKFHVDPSSTTAGFGFAIAHTERFTDQDDREELHVVFDVIKRWLPSEFGGKVIDWKPIREEILMYADIFRPFEITMDQHQSAEPMQILQEELQAKRLEGIRVYEKTATNELNWKRWEVFKTACYGGYIHAPFDTPDDEWAAQELKFLQENRTGGKFPRVDKQDIGPVQTKDMADCMCECVFTLIGNMMTNRTRERLSESALVGGAQGGYALGLGSEGPPRGGPGPENVSKYYHESNQNINPARGIVSTRGGRRGRLRSRW